MISFAISQEPNVRIMETKGSGVQPACAASVPLAISIKAMGGPEEGETMSATWDTQASNPGDNGLPDGFHALHRLQSL